MADLSGVIAGRYEILGELGRGGSAVTYRARDTTTGGEVAIKALSLATMESWKALELFEREARVLESLDHPGIPAYVDMIAPDPSAADGDSEATFALVQELAAGRDLSKRLAEGWRADEETVRDIARQVLEILVYLHQLSPPVVHRDIKPQNLLIDDERVVRLVDFGAVRERLASQTEMGSTVVGTFGYMAPEQFQGRAEPASDLYGLGATLVHLLTGTAPAELPHARLKLVFDDRTSVSRQLVSWVDDLVEPAVEDRHPSARVALDRLDGPTEEEARELAVAGLAEARGAMERQLRNGDLAGAFSQLRELANNAGPMLQGLARTEAVPPGTDLTVQPVGSNIRLDRSPERLDIQIPPSSRLASAPMAGFSIAWLSFVAFWTAAAIGAGAPIFFPLFSIPFWAVGIGMVWSAAKKMLQTTRLSLDRDTFQVSKRMLGIVFGTRTGRTADVVSLGVHDTAIRVNNRPVRRLILKEGIREHNLSSSVDPIEGAWLGAELERFRAQAIGD